MSKNKSQRDLANEKFMEIDKQAYDMFLQGKSLVAISKELKLDRPSLTTRLKMKYDIKPAINGRKYSFTEDYFHVIDTEEKAYWLGFIMADGHVSNKGLEITLQERDVHHLEKFRDAIGANHPISKKDNSYRISIDSVNLRDKLKSYLGDNKTYEADIPKRKFKTNLYRHFIRGLFDGDGHIGTISTKEDKIGVNRRNKNIHFCSITTGSIKMKNTLIDFFKRYLDIDLKPYDDKRSMAIDLVIHGQKDIIYFLDYIYGQSTIHLDRKYYSYLHYMMPSGVETLQMISGEKIWNPEMGIRGEGTND